MQCLFAEHLSIWPLKCSTNKAMENQLIGGVWALSSMKWLLDYLHSILKAELSSSKKSNSLILTFQLL